MRSPSTLLRTTGKGSEIAEKNPCMLSLSMHSAAFQESPRLEFESLAAFFARSQSGIGLQRIGCFVHRVARIIEAHFGFVKVIAAVFTGPDTAVDFCRIT